MQLKSNRDGLTLALALAITAPSDDKARDALALAEEFAAACTAADIRKAKRDAIRHVKNDTWQGVQP
jgi:hypothetical protein